MQLDLLRLRRCLRVLRMHTAASSPFAMVTICMSFPVEGREQLETIPKAMGHRRVSEAHVRVLESPNMRSSTRISSGVRTTVTKGDVQNRAPFRVWECTFQDTSTVPKSHQQEEHEALFVSKSTLSGVPAVYVRRIDFICSVFSCWHWHRFPTYSLPTRKQC